MGLLNYLGGRGSSGFGEGSSRHVESDVGGVTVGGAALEEEKSWEQPDPSVDNVPFILTRGTSATRDGIASAFAGSTTTCSTRSASW